MATMSIAAAFVGAVVLPPGVAAIAAMILGIVYLILRGEEKLKKESGEQ